VTIAVINNVMTGGPRPYVCCLSVRFALLPQTKPHPLLSAAPVNHKGSDGFGGGDHLRQRDVFVGAVNTHRAVTGAKVDRRYMSHSRCKKAASATNLVPEKIGL
jgi:hypothetical protein